MKTVQDVFEKSFVRESLQIIARLELIHYRQSYPPCHPEALAFGQVPSAAEEALDYLDFSLGQQMDVRLSSGGLLHANECRVRNSICKGFRKCRRFVGAFAYDDCAGENVAEPL